MYTEVAVWLLRVLFLNFFPVPIELADSVEDSPS
jgi:hypothetical protein